MIDVAVELRTLPASFRVAFVALAVERLVRSYRWAAALTTDLPQRVLESVWGDRPDDRSAMVEQLEAVFPDEDDPSVGSMLPILQDPPAAMLYLLSYARTEHDDDAVWATSQAESTLWEILTHANVTDPNDPAQFDAFLTHPLVVRERVRQARDLEALRSLSPSEDAHKLRRAHEHEEVITRSEFADLNAQRDQVTFRGTD